MQKILTITTRELLHDFRHYKELLKCGEINSIELPLGDSITMDIRLKNPANTAANILAAAKKIHLQNKLSRVNLFDKISK